MHKKLISRDIKEAVREPIHVMKTKIDRIIEEKERRIFEDMSFLLNVSRHKNLSEMDLIDRVIIICSMYCLPSVYRYFFSEFIPSLMKDAKSFNYDSLLIKIQKLISKLVIHFEGGGLNYQNLYQRPEAEESILTLGTKLFSTIYSEKQQFIGDGHMMSTLIDGSFRLSRTVSVVSPSIMLEGLHTRKLEEECLRCIHYIARFLQKFMPVFFIKVRKIENILMFFENIFRLEFGSVRKISLGTFCEINLSFLQFWAILELYSLGVNSSFIFELMRNLRERYFSFNLNYFSCSVYSFDCYKEYNEVESIERILRHLDDLYFIHTKIVTFADDPNTRLMHKNSQFIYGQAFMLTGRLGPDFEVYVSKKPNGFTVDKVFSLLGQNQPGGASQQIFLNILPKSSDIALRNSRKLQKIIGDLIADEIEKIKGFFYTKLKHDSRHPDLLGLKKVSEADFEGDLSVLFWENPLTALTYSLRLYSEIKNPKQIFISKVLGPLVDRCVEVFIQYREFLASYLDYKAETTLDSLKGLDIVMYWEMPFIPIILKYIGQKYDKFELLGNFFAKMMLRINSGQLSFYLSQIFQSLDYATASIIEEFMVKYSESSPLFAHQVIWMARVEEKADTESELTTNSQKRNVAAGIPLKIIKNMGLEEKRFWDEVDSFYEQITKISSVLKPKMPKQEKKDIINKRLEMIKMPPLVYMPTNPDYRVSRIKLGSGNPMQSAAKCPIWVSFYCKKFEGPDEYFATLKAKKEDPLMERESMVNDDLDEHVPPMASKLNNRSLSIKDNKIMRESKLILKESSNFERSPSENSKLNNITEELFPIFASQKNLGILSKIGLEHSKVSNSPFKKSPYSDNGQFINLQWNDLSTPFYGLSEGKTPSRMAVTAMGASTSPFHNPKTPPSQAQMGMQASSQRKTPRKDRETEDEEVVVSCIFKTFDDIRRDNLALQIIRIFQEVFAVERLDLFLFPYKTISTRTGNEKTIGGIIEVVPNTFSRDQIGKENKYSLYEFFQEKYGSELGRLFQEARENFVKSMAAYSVISYILQIKDRHNGNILIDQMGRLIHIDFGFIFSISPGKNLGFENAQFKLTT